MEKKTLSAREAVSDIRVGMTDEQLMAKYGLSAKGLASLKNKLVQAGLIMADECGRQTTLPPNVGDLGFLPASPPSTTDKRIGRVKVLAGQWFQRYSTNRTRVKRESVKTKVTEHGLLIPREMFAGAEEVEIRKEGDRIIISPVLREDPIRDLGKHPVECGASDASEHHDLYLYGSR